MTALHRYTPLHGPLHPRSGARYIGSPLKGERAAHVAPRTPLHRHAWDISLSTNGNRAVALARGRHSTTTFGTHQRAPDGRNGRGLVRGYGVTPAAATPFASDRERSPRDAMTLIRLAS